MQIFRSNKKRIHNKIYNKAAQQLEVKALLLPDDMWKQCLLTQLVVLESETTTRSRNYFGTPSKQELEALCWKYLFSQYEVPFMHFIAPFVEFAS